jgi:phage-related tail protein
MDITLNDFLKKAEESVTPAEWFLYNAFSANCQFFIRIILKSHNLYNEATDKFVFQNIEELVKKSPKIVGKIANIVTDTAGVVSRAVGKGKGSAKNKLMKLQHEIKFINDVLRHGTKKERLQLSKSLNSLI